MWDWLDRLRQKPKPVRDQYAFFGAAGVTAIVALFWAVSLPAHLGEMGQTKDGPEQEAIGAFGQFFSDAKQNLGAIFQASLQGQTATSTATSTVPKPGVIMPTLDEETIEQVIEESNQPVGRPVLIEMVSETNPVATTTSN